MFFIKNLKEILNESYYVYPPYITENMIQAVSM